MVDHCHCVYTHTHVRVRVRVRVYIRLMGDKVCFHTGVNMNLATERRVRRG